LKRLAQTRFTLGQTNKKQTRARAKAKAKVKIKAKVRASNNILRITKVKAKANLAPLSIQAATTAVTKTISFVTAQNPNLRIQMPATAGTKAILRTNITADTKAILITKVTATAGTKVDITTRNMLQIYLRMVPLQTFGIMLGTITVKYPTGTKTLVVHSLW
jgi:hypothetical protein